MIKEEEIRYEMDRLGFFEPGVGIRSGGVEIEKYAGKYIGGLKFDSLECDSIFEACEETCVPLLFVSIVPS